MKANHIPLLTTWLLALVVLLALLPYKAAANDNTALDEQFIQAGKAEQLDQIKALLPKGADVNARDKDGITPLMVACELGNVEVAKVLLDKNADVNAKTEYGSTPLRKAIDSGEIELVKLLVDNGADVNARQSDGSTPLMWAAILGQTEVVKLLLDKGAKVNTKTKEGTTALKWAALMQQGDIANLLKSHGAEITLHIAAILGDEKVAGRLIDSGADVNAADWDGWTPLMYAARNGHANLVNILLDNNADLHAEREGRRTAFEYALTTGRTNVCDVILDRAPELASRPMADGRLTFTQARTLNHMEIMVRLLQSKGADVNEQSAAILHCWQHANWELHLS